MQILQKHLFAFGFVVLTLLVPTIYALWQLENTKKQVDSIHHNWLPSVALITNINMMTSDFRIEELQHASTTSAQEMRFCEERMSSLRGKIENSQKQYKKLIVYEEEKELFEKFERLWDRYLLLNHEFLRLSGENQNAEAVKLLDKDAWQTFQEFSKILNELVEINEKGSLSATEHAENTLQSTYQWTGIWLFIAVSGAILMISWLVRSIVLPVQLLEKNANELSKGNFNLPKFKITNQDEIGSLAQSFEKMAEKITENNRFNEMQKAFYEQVRLSSAPAEIAEQVFSFLEKQMPFLVGTFYQLTENQLVLKTKYAVSKPIETFNLGEGLVGQVGLKGNFLRIQTPNAPQSASGNVGDILATDLFIFAYCEGKIVKGVFEIGVSKPFSETELRFLNYLTQRFSLE